MNLLIGLLLLSSAFARPSPSVKYVGLRTLGKYSGVNEEGIAYEKSFFVSSYLKMTPPAARSFCKSFGPQMDLVSFESRNEFLAVRSKFEPEVLEKGISLIIGGFAHTATNGRNIYHWMSSGLKMFSDLEAPMDKPCLGIWKTSTDPVGFVSISCDQSLKFACQETDFQYAN